jgi:UPF0755 protein
MSRLVRLSVLIGSFVALIFFTYLKSPVNKASSTQQEFIIQSGQSLDTVTSNLKKQKLIRSKALAKLFIIYHRISQDIQAGYFYLSPSSNLTKIVLSLTKSSSKQVWVTIPEGLRRQEIALIIEREFGLSSPNHQFNSQEFIARTSSLEGRLFPETYAFSPDSSVQTIIDILTGQFDIVIKDLSIPSQELSTTLILASLVEREAGHQSEMSDIAGVLKKRLAANWPLQIDATVQFALANHTCFKLQCDYWTNYLSREDLQVDSLYNTYKHSGLPPGPISSPGIDAIKASFSSTPSNYWFYLHDPTGQIHFAKTLEGHNQNVCQYLNKDC